MNWIKKMFRLLFNSIPYSNIENGTSTETIKDMIRKTENQNLPLIFFSTYHSADIIENEGQIN